MLSEEEDSEIKVFWGDFNDFMLEEWVSTMKNLFTYTTDDYRPVSKPPDKPWEFQGTDINDWFNFGFTEESYQNFLLEIIQRRQAKILEEEKQLQAQRELLSRQRRSRSPERHKPRKHDTPERHSKHYRRDRYDDRRRRNSRERDERSKRVRYDK
jgi:hypothetical protein